LEEVVRASWISAELTEGRAESGRLLIGQPPRDRSLALPSAAGRLRDASPRSRVPQWPGCSVTMQHACGMTKPRSSAEVQPSSPGVRCPDREPPHNRAELTAESAHPWRAGDGSSRAADGRPRYARAVHPTTLDGQGAGRKARSRRPVRSALLLARGRSRSGRETSTRRGHGGCVPAESVMNAGHRRQIGSRTHEAGRSNARNDQTVRRESSCGRAPGNRWRAAMSAASMSRVPVATHSV
jgi:hypothetical protein